MPALPNLMQNFPSPRALWSGLLHLFYPELCVACGGDLPVGTPCFCLRCRARLPLSDMYRTPDNEFTERFWGRITLQSGAAAYYYTRRSPIRMAIHHLKYKNKPEIGIMLGREFGRKLQETGLYQADLILPVPLHPRKERLRGYNQSAMFAQGLSEVLEIPMLPRALRRARFTQTQTRKKRMERFVNVGEVFEVEKPAMLQNKHLLLVDDVLTTGATLERCGEALLQVEGVRLSFLTIAIATL